MCNTAEVSLEVSSLSSLNTNNKTVLVFGERSCILTGLFTGACKTVNVGSEVSTEMAKSNSVKCEQIAEQYFWKLQGVEPMSSSNEIVK